jgi:hypothetical protein
VQEGETLQQEFRYRPLGLQTGTYLRYLYSSIIPSIPLISSIECPKNLETNENGNNFFLIDKLKGERPSEMATRTTWLQLCGLYIFGVTGRQNYMLLEFKIFSTNVVPDFVGHRVIIFMVHHLKKQHFSEKDIYSFRSTYYSEQPFTLGSNVSWKLRSSLER